MAIGISNKAQETYQFQTGAGTVKQRFSQTVRSDALSLPDKTNRRDVFELSSNDKFDYYCDYDGYANLGEYVNSIRYRYEHTISHNALWFSEEVGNDLQEIKEEKGYYDGSDMLNAYGYTYARLYAEIEQRYENGDGQWFDLNGKPLTKEMEMEELNKAYESAVEWTTNCAEVMADIQNVHWTSLSDSAQNYDGPEPEIPKLQHKDSEEMKRALYEARDKYMELYKECKQTGNPLTRQDYIFGNNALFAVLAKTWLER